MLQHDLKTHETRLDNPRLVAWCICGSWTYHSIKLAQGPMVNGFIEHLDSIQAERGETGAPDFSESF